MPNILTPVSLWKNFDDSLPADEHILIEKTDGGQKIQYLNFYGRETGAGRVKIYAAFMCDATAPSDDVVILLPDSVAGIDEKLMRFFCQTRL